MRYVNGKIFFKELKNCITSGYSINDCIALHFIEYPKSMVLENLFSSFTLGINRGARWAIFR